MTEPRRAVVRPRVYTPGAGIATSLEEEVLDRLEAKAWGAVELCGGPGAGKSMALEHLAALFGDDLSLVLADGPNSEECDRLSIAAADHVVVYATRKAAVRYQIVERWLLAPWAEDEWIEYLLAAHRDACASVMSRLRADSQRRWPGGTAEIWRVVLDLLAEDHSCLDVKSALRSDLLRRLGEAAGIASESCFEHLAYPADDDRIFEPKARLGAYEAGARSLLRHAQVRVLLAADHGFLRRSSTKRRSESAGPSPSSTTCAVSLHRVKPSSNPWRPVCCTPPATIGCRQPGGHRC
jgi:hypothetical protein